MHGKLVKPWMNLCFVLITAGLFMLHVAPWLLQSTMRNIPIPRASGLGGGTCGTPYSYAYSNSITIPAQSSMSADLSPFTMVMPVSGSTKWATVANGGFMQQSNANDLIFCTTASGSGGTVIPHELEASSYNATTGAGIWWVKIPTLSKGSTTTIYYYIGNASAPTRSNPWTVAGSITTGTFIVGETLTIGTSGQTGVLIQATPTFIVNQLSCAYCDNMEPSSGAVWLGGSSAATFTGTATALTSGVWPNYISVNHFGTPSTLSLTDDASIYNVLTNHNTVGATSGAIGGAGSYLIASSRYLSVAEIGSSTDQYNVTPNTFSTTVWINPSALPAAYGMFFSNFNHSTSGFSQGIKSTGKLYTAFLPFQADGTGSHTLSTSTAYMIGSDWNNTSHAVHVYVNGASDLSTTGSNAMNNSSVVPSIGRYDGSTPNYYYSGWIDELRFCNCTISADQRLSEYNNESAPNSFATIN